jgi:hypothetical protein
MKGAGHSQGPLGLLSADCQQISLKIPEISDCRRSQYAR